MQVAIGDWVSGAVPQFLDARPRALELLFDQAIEEHCLGPAAVGERRMSLDGDAGGQHPLERANDAEEFVQPAVGAGHADHDSVAPRQPSDEDGKATEDGGVRPPATEHAQRGEARARQDDLAPQRGVGVAPSLERQHLRAGKEAPALLPFGCQARGAVGRTLLAQPLSDVRILQRKLAELFASEQREQLRHHRPERSAVGMRSRRHDLDLAQRRTTAQHAHF